MSAAESATGAAVLPHGFTADGMERLAWIAVLHGRHASQVRDLDEHRAIARTAMVEALYAAAQRPNDGHLVLRGRYAVYRSIRTRRRHHGAGAAGRFGSAPRFAQYWLGSTRAHGHEERVVEREALAQVWAHLTPLDREALTALAEHGDFQLAADALGVPYGTFAGRIRFARRRFFALWHEGETPRGMWRVDRRAGHPGLHGAASPAAKLTVDQVRAIRTRYAAGGERQVDLAAEFGVCQSLISSLVRGKGWQGVAA